MTRYYQGDKIKEGEMDRVCNVHGTGSNFYRTLIGKHEGKRPLGRPRHR
jgi:hypothetical protein